MKKRCLAAEEEIRRALLRYLVENPEASDTLKGITQWWLLEESVRSDRATVESVVARLVDKRLLLEHRSKDGRRHFRVNREKLDQIRDLLTRSDC